MSPAKQRELDGVTGLFQIALPTWPLPRLKESRLRAWKLRVRKSEIDLLEGPDPGPRTPKRKHQPQHRLPSSHSIAHWTTTYTSVLHPRGVG